MREFAYPRINLVLFLLFLLALVGLSGVGCGGGGTCADGEKRCQGQCVNNATDPDNCGGCNVICDAEKVCSLGACADSCAQGLEKCGRSCVDLNSDLHHCGSCDRDCGKNGVCQMGQCQEKPDGGPPGDGGGDGKPPVCQERVLLQQNGVYDVPLKVVSVSGRLTKNGAKVPDSVNGSRGSIVFTNVRGGQRRMASLSSSGEATYQGEIFAGTYDVAYEPPYCSEGGALPCQRAPLRTKVAIQANGTLDLDLKVISVSGRVTRNGATLPDSSLGGRGSIVFALVDGGTRRMPNLSSSGEATYQGEIFAGTYDVAYEPPSSCSEGGALPCQRNLLRSKFALSSSGTLDLDLKVITVSGRVTKNGATLPESLSGGSRGTINFTLGEGNTRRMPNLSSSGEATYQGEIFAGTYDVAYEPPSSCSEGGTLPCQRNTLRSKLALSSSGTLDLDLKVIMVSGRVTRNGSTLPESKSGGSRGAIAFSLTGGNIRRMPNLSSSGEATYQGEIFAGTYDVAYEPPYSCSEGGALPCQRNTLRSKLVLSSSGTLDLDLKVITVSGRVTKNGAILPESTTSSGRGTISFSLAEGNLRRMPSLSSSGEATYQGEIFAGTYDVAYEPPYSCSDGGALPCQRSTLRSKLALQSSGTLDLDLKVITLSGRVTKNGGAVPDGTGSRGSIAFNLAQGSERRMPSLSAAGEATYQGDIFAGSYDILYQPPSSCAEGGPLPCQSLLIAGCPINTTTPKQP